METNQFFSLGKTVIELKTLETKKWVQVRFPKSKKKRIRKKWAKRVRNYSNVPTYFCIKNGNILYVNSPLFQKMKDNLPTVTI